MMRRSPTRHRVSSHYRQGRWVESFYRGQRARSTQKKVVAGENVSYLVFREPMDLRIVRDKGHKVSKSDIKKIVKRLPKRAIKDILTVHLSKDAETSYMIGNNITIADLVSKRVQLRFTIPHEFGHALWRNLSTEEKEQYKRIIGERHYPKGKPVEAFTDDFALVFSRQKLYDVPKENREKVRGFMKKLIKEG